MVRTLSMIHRRRIKIGLLNKGHESLILVFGETELIMGRFFNQVSRLGRCIWSYFSEVNRCNGGIGICASWFFISSMETNSPITSLNGMISFLSLFTKFDVLVRWLSKIEVFGHPSIGFGEGIMLGRISGLNRKGNKVLRHRRRKITHKLAFMLKDNWESFDNWRHRINDHHLGTNLGIFIVKATKEPNDVIIFPFFLEFRNKITRTFRGTVAEKDTTIDFNFFP